MWFIIERLEPMPIEVLVKTSEELARDLKRLAPDAVVASQLLQK